MSANGKIETLETRRLLSAGATVTVLGTAGNDTIRIGAAGTAISVTVNDQVTSYEQADVSDLLIYAGAGDDSVIIYDGIALAATIYGQGGNDTLRGGDGDDLLSGGVDSDLLDGGAGTNTADYSDHWLPISSITDYSRRIYSAGGETDQLTVNFQRLIGGSGNDSIEIFSSALTYVDAGAGNDHVKLINNAGRDVTVHGGAGNDDIYIETHQHIGEYYGDAGDDYFRVYRGTGTARYFHGGDGIDTADMSESGGSYTHLKVTLDDIANDGTGGELLPGYNAPTLDNVHSDVERVIGTSGDDKLVGSNNDNTLIGNGGDDSLVGGGGSDCLVGGEGDDTIIADADDVVLDDGSNIYPPPPTPPIAIPPVINNPSLINHILRINGTSSNDRITVRRSSTDAGVLQVVLNGKIRSFTFSDVTKVIIDGKEGDDFINLKGIAITSTVFGGKGNDTILGSDAADSIAGGTGDDSIYGYAGNDSLGGNDGNDYICGGAGIDLIRGGGGIDTIVGRFKVDDLKDNKGDALVNDVL